MMTKFVGTQYNVCNMKMGTYLRQNYPNKFNYVPIYFDDVEPRFKYNIDEDDMIDEDNSQLLEDSSPEIGRIWKRVLDSGYSAKVHDIIKVYFKNIQDRYYGGLVFFISDDGIYVTSGHYYAPDEFYNFLERLGLGENFNEYIYRNSGPWFRRNKWPYKVNTKEKL